MAQYRLIRIFGMLSIVVVAALLPTVAHAAFCSDKANGWWCDGSNLVVCQNGSQSSSESCSCGCKSMPPGEADKCEACGGFCGSKANGWWCDGDNLLVCQNGSETSSEKCSCGCKSMPPGEADKCESCGGFCGGKDNGWWCDGDNLVICQNGSQTSSENCSCGCKSMPPGEPDKCDSCGFCNGKSDGNWCDGSWLVHCSGGNESNSQQCDNGCTGGNGSASCKDPEPQGFCDGLDNGHWCDGAKLVECQGGNQVSSETCEFGCKSMPPGQPDKCDEEDVPEGFCDGLDSGHWCDGAKLVECQGGNQVSSETCEFGCKSMPPGEPDKCDDEEVVPVEDFCGDKKDGAWCDGVSLLECAGGKTVSSQVCEFGCKSMPPGQPDKCDEEDVEPGSFCSGKADGFWCNGELLTLCSGGALDSSVACPKGCKSMDPGTDDECITVVPNTPDGTLLSVAKEGSCGQFSGNIDLWDGTGLKRWNQKDWPSDTLGTCDGLTIKSSGCTVTALSMLYAYVGKPRSVDGKSGNKPPLEDGWRTVIEKGHTRGYAGTDYSIDGKSKQGECLARWDKNPSGITLQYHYNTASGCVEYGAAVAIANSLNSGVPVLAGVHWESGEEDQHWMLIIGSKNGNLLFNDPWGGARVEGLSKGSLGSYTIDTFFTPYIDGGIGGPGEGAAVFDESGEPVSDERTVSRLPAILDDDAPTNPAFVIPLDEIETTDEPASGCGTANAPQSRLAIALLFFTLLLAIANRRSRCD
jgi:hypothetical protein